MENDLHDLLIMKDQKTKLYPWVGLGRMCDPQRSLQSIKSRSNFTLQRKVSFNHSMLSTNMTPLVDLTEISELILHYI